MGFDSKKHRRRSIRLEGYDYSQAGEYFVTLCTHRMRCLFGRVRNGEMEWNTLGWIVRNEWLRTPWICPEIELDEFVVMPNHLHAIIVIRTGWEERIPASRVYTRAHGRAPLRRSSRSLGSLIGGFKSACTIRINRLRETPGGRVWQRNYFEHVIRDDEELDHARQYISRNPLHWELDQGETL